MTTTLPTTTEADVPYDVQKETGQNQIGGGPAHRSALSLTVLSLLGAFLALLVLVETGWGPVGALDRAVADGLNRLVADRHGVVAATQLVTDLGGGGMTWWLVLSATAVGLLLNRHPRAALFVAVTGAGGGLLNRAVKAAVGRSRPELAEPVSQAGGFAFPSGHAMGSAIGIGVLLIVLLPRMPARWLRPVAVAGTLFALAVGASRVVLGVHWLSDVLAGWLLAAAWLLTMYVLFRPCPARADATRRRPTGTPRRARPRAVQQVFTTPRQPLSARER